MKGSCTTFALATFALLSVIGSSSQMKTNGSGINVGSFSKAKIGKGSNGGSIRELKNGNGSNSGISKLKNGAGGKTMRWSLKNLLQESWNKVGKDERKIVPVEAVEKSDEEKWQQLFLNDPKLKFKKGDLLVSRHGRLMLAIGKTHYVRMPWEHGFFQGFTWLIKLKIPFPKEKNTYVYKMLDIPDGYDPERAVTLAKLLIGKKLPFFYCTCHEVDWMDYICYGKVKSHFLQYKCPLNRPLDNVEIGKNFYFKNGIGERIYAKDLESVKLDENFQPVKEDEQSPKSKGLIQRFKTMKKTGSIKALGSSLSSMQDSEV